MIVVLKMCLRCSLAVLVMLFCGCGKESKESKPQRLPRAGVKNPFNCRTTIEIDGSPITSGFVIFSVYDHLVNDLALSNHPSASLEFDVLPPLENQHNEFYLVRNKEVKIELTANQIKQGAATKHEFSWGAIQATKPSKLVDLQTEDFLEAEKIYSEVISSMANIDFLKLGVPYEEVLDGIHELGKINTVGVRAVQQMEDIEILKGRKTVLFRLKEKSVLKYHTNEIVAFYNNTGQKIFVEGVLLGKSNSGTWLAPSTSGWLPVFK